MTRPAPCSPSAPARVHGLGAVRLALVALIVTACPSLQADEKAPGLPSKGKASSYAARFEGKKTSSGEVFKQDLYTAAIMPRARWKTVKLGTRVKITHAGRSVVVKINDRGAGDGSLERVLDLTWKAMGYLVDKEIKSDADALKVGVITLNSIVVVPETTPLGPVK
jgi:rare lipoprotein A